MTDETLGEPKREMKYNLFDLAKRTFARKIDASYTIGGYEELIAACDEALNWADANARWFDISTAPKEIGVEFLACLEIGNSVTAWKETHILCLDEDGINTDYHKGWEIEDYSHWAPLPPPPSNPPLPEPLERLGEVLRKVKGA